MKFYTVHENAGRADPDERIVLVREGFIWPAFWAPVAWLIYKRAWLGVPLYFAALLALILLIHLAGVPGKAIGIFASTGFLSLPALLFFIPSVLSLIGVVFAGLCGFEAGDVLRFSLARRGYRLVGVVSGKTETEAEMSYFSAHGLPGNPPPAGPWGGKDSGGPTPISDGTDQPAARRAGLWAKTSEPILGLFPGPDHHG
jgi:hypothetical protein